MIYKINQFLIKNENTRSILFFLTIHIPRDTKGNLFAEGGKSQIKNELIGCGSWKKRVCEYSPRDFFMKLRVSEPKCLESQRFFKIARTSKLTSAVVA